MTTHTPIRSCIACRCRRPATALLRFRRRSDGEIQLVSRFLRPSTAAKPGPNPKKTGRSAYLCPQRSCFDKALRRDPFQRAFRAKTKLPSEPELFWSQCLAELVEGQGFLYRKHRAAADCDAASLPLPAFDPTPSMISGSALELGATRPAQPTSALESSCDRSIPAKGAPWGDAIGPSRSSALCAARRAL